MYPAWSDLRAAIVNDPARRNSDALLILFVTLIMAGLSHAQSALSKPSQEPFSIAIAPLDRVVKAGSEVFVKVRITNTSKHDTFARGTLYADGLNIMFQYDCRNAAGKSVKREILPMGSIGDVQPSFTVDGKAVPPVDSRVAPGDSYEETAPVSRACYLSRPGQYEVQVSRKIPGDPEHREVKSNKITLIVTP